MYILATIHVVEGRLEQAGTLLIQTMKFTAKVFGSSHSDTLRHMRLLSTVYAQQGRLEEAEILEVLSDINHLGPDMSVLETFSFSR